MEIIFTPDPIFLKKLQGLKKSNIIQFPRREGVGDRFYQQQLEALGDCPGNKNPTKRNKKVAWDDDKKAQAVSMYEAVSYTHLTLPTNREV